MYEYYKALFGGVKIDDELMFSKFLIYAKAYLKRTCALGHVLDFEDEDTKMCLCALCDTLYDQLETNHVDREEWDGFVRSYKNVNWYSELYKTACLFLPAEYLYRGCCA